MFSLFQFRLKELVVSLDQVKSEHFSCGGLYKEIFEAADLYGIFEDLYGRDKFFRYFFLEKMSETENVKR